ncbi:amino acid ABC transporter substrate-binding protein [Deferribacter abyssi]|uniref:amino acid ABC transporter substrate-binding protein n=1 Tax=Deferribacter abyssi TaxID=213806 RepID=UPI003C271405
MNKIEKNGTIKIGFRDHLYPFSYIDSNKKFKGFAVDFANLLVEKLSDHFGKPIKLIPVQITTQNRFEKIVNNDIDIEMGSTTYSFDREKIVDFSFIYFFSETTIIFNKNIIKNSNDLNDKIVAVTKNTTNYRFLVKFLKNHKIKLKKLVLLKEHFDSLPLLEQEKIDAFCSDRTILLGIMKKIKNKNKFTISNTPIGYEPYAFMLPENNSDFRDFVNNFLIWTIKTNLYFDIYKKWFKINNTTIPISPYLREYLSVISFDLPSNWWRKNSISP